MYRNAEVYDRIAQIVIDIYIDYDIRTFPVDEKDLCRKLGVILIPYSRYANDEQELLVKYSKYGFFVSEGNSNPPTIYFNDLIASIGAQRFTIFHEIKHYVFEDKSDTEDDIADYFARYFMCPIPYLIQKNICSEKDIVLNFGTSMDVAKNVASNISNRIARYGKKIFPYEMKLIEHLNSTLIL